VGIRRPWNISEHSVYSLATYAPGELNMNICTYVTAVSRSPRLYMIALDPNTKTYENIMRTEISVLQLLNVDQLGIINLLGKRSGWQVNKQDKLERKELLTTWKEHKVLRGVNALIELQFEEELQFQSDADHRLCLFRVKSSSSFKEEGVLTLQQLISENLILA